MTKKHGEYGVVYRLSPAHKAVARAVRAGLGDRETAAKLGFGEGKVKQALQQLYRAFDVPVSAGRCRRVLLARMLTEPNYNGGGE